MPQSLPTCHNCTKKYTKDPHQIPLLLQCGHTFCESCITRFGRFIKYAGNITCPECGDNHHIDSIKCIKQLQINSHIFGIISAPNRKTENAVDNMVQDLTNKLNDIAVQQCNVSEEMEEEEEDEEYPPCCECQAKSDVFCPACNLAGLPYCQDCSDQAHKLVALQKHFPEPIQPKALFEVCAEHTAAVPVDFLLLSGQPVCPECPAPGNTATILNTAEHMAVLSKQHDQALAKLMESDQCISELIPTVEQDFTRLKCEVRKEFAYFHGLLQAREQQLLDNLETKQTQTVQPLLDIRCEIARSTRAHRADFNWVLKNKEKRSLLVRKQRRVQEIKKAIEAAKTTLYVRSEKRPTMNTKKGMLSQCINEFCRLSTDTVHVYEIGSVDSKIGRRYRDEEPLFMPLDWESGHLPPSAEGTKPLDPLKVELATAENKEVVVVSVVYSPQCFYVQKTKDRNDLDELQNILVKYYGLSVSTDDYVSHVIPGDLVCCQFVDELWYRAEVRAVEVREEGARNTDIVTVLYIDYGNSEDVSIKKLRRLKPQFTRCSAMAIKCAMYGVKPRDGEDWTAESCDSLTRLTDQNELEMITYGKVEDYLEVDLLQCGNDIGSTREFLVFLEHACFSTRPKSPEMEAVQVAPTDLPWPHAPGEDEYVQVTLSHMENPGKFYVQLETSSDVIMRIGTDIADHMNAIGKNYPLQELKKGMISLARYTGDGKYYRAVILGALQFHVVVFFCDYGNEGCVQRNNLYEITAALAGPPRQTITCALSGIRPGALGGSSDKWSNQECTVFDELSNMKQLFAKLHVVNEDGMHVVSLTDTSLGDEDIDITVEMVGRGAGHLLKSAAVGPGELSPGQVNSTREVIICHVESPHHIRVNLSDVPYPPFFNDLNLAYKKLVKTGNRVVEKESNWNIGDLCVAHLAEQDLFIRAEILSFEIPQSAMVENIDQGRVTKVSLNDLKVLIIDFINQPKFAVPCKLYDVGPVEDEGWTADQKKCVLKYFSRKIKKGKACFFATVMGPRDKGASAWPIDIVVRDPGLNKRERVSEEFIKMGLVKPLTEVVRPTPESYTRVSLTEKDSPLRAKVLHVSHDCTIHFTTDSLKPEAARLSSELALFEGKAANVLWELGAACVAKCENKHYRGVVTGLTGCTRIEVALVDVGTIKQLSPGHVYPAMLCPDIPALAVPAQLAHVEASWYSGEGMWSHAASVYLYEKAVNERCEINIVGKPDDHYLITLTLRSGEEMAECLIQKGFAVGCTPSVLSPVTSGVSSPVARPFSPVAPRTQTTSPPTMPGSPPSLPVPSPTVLPDTKFNADPPRPTAESPPSMPAAHLPVAQLPVAQLPTAQLPTAHLPTAHLPTAQLPTAHLPTAQVPIPQVPASPPSESPATPPPELAAPMPVFGVQCPTSPDQRPQPSNSSPQEACIIDVLTVLTNKNLLTHTNPLIHTAHELTNDESTNAASGNETQQRDETQDETTRHSVCYYSKV